jgi:class 3 adenylate cyclase
MSARERLTKEQVEGYRRDGYVVVEDCIPSHVVSALRQEVTRFQEEARGMTKSNDRLDLEDSHTPEDPRVRRIKLPHTTSDVVRDLLYSDSVLAPARDLLGPDISDELTTVAGRNLPVSQAMARTNVRILEQGVVLQRLFVFAGESDVGDPFQKSAQRLKVLGGEVRAEFDALRLLLGGGVGAKSASRTDATLRGHIEGIEKSFDEFETRGRMLAAARKSGDRGTFDTLLPQLNTHQDVMSTKIAELRRHLEKSTGLAVGRAEDNERHLVMVNSLLTGLAAVLGILFALAVTRALVSAVRDLVSGTEAVESGNLDVEVRVHANDEVGKLTQAFNTMVKELRLKERIKETFGKYMDPRIVTNLLEHPEFSEPGGERREMTVMFIDLKGFTSISEALDADETVHMVNGFFDHMTNAISENGGVVDKFMGDAVMAYWGPPFTDADEHAVLACRAATQALDHLECFRSDVSLQLGQKADNLDIDLRIGVSTGEMVVGTIGAKMSRNFTVMGDPVNLGSRLEGANKSYGTRIMISERTRALLGDALPVRELDLIRVKGKHEPTRVFELLSDGSNLQPTERFLQGLDAYRKQDWKTAESYFEAYLAAVPDDPPSITYLGRISEMRNNPPPPDWDGVWTFVTK